jgi:hypothetical protein
MTWQSYDLDRTAQRLVLAAKARDEKTSAKADLSMKEAHKMRMTVAYGLERFWGEHLRLQHKEPNKSEYWQDTWKALVKTMETAGITLPDKTVNGKAVPIPVVVEQLWGEAALHDGTKLSQDDQRLALAVLTQLCDCMVWWTQRFRDPSSSGEEL